MAPYPEHPLAATVYTSGLEPAKTCALCKASPAKLRAIYESKTLECSAVECPHRKGVTAKPSQRPPTTDF